MLTCSTLSQVILLTLCIALYCNIQLPQWKMSSTIFSLSFYPVSLSCLFLFFSPLWISVLCFAPACAQTPYHSSTTQFLASTFQHSQVISKLKKPKFLLTWDEKQQLLKVALHSSPPKITARKTWVNYFPGALNIKHSGCFSKISNLFLLLSPLNLNLAKDLIKLEAVQ